MVVVVSGERIVIHFFLRGAGRIDKVIIKCDRLICIVYNHQQQGNFFWGVLLVTEALAGISSTSFKILCHSKASKENLYLISECQCRRFCN